MSAVSSAPTRATILRWRLRWRLEILAANYRLARIDRLIEAGKGREARRVMAIVKRDVRRHLDLLNSM